jgi:hypothetical protein
MVMLKKSGMAKNKNRGPVKKGGPLLDYKKIAGMGGNKAKPKTSSGRPKKSNPFAKSKPNNKSTRLVDKVTKKSTVTPKPKKTFKKITPKAGEYRSGNVLRNIVDNQRKVNKMKVGGKTSKYRMKGGGKTSKYRMKGGGKTSKYMARGGRAK